MAKIYLIGSLKNENVTKFAAKVRDAGFEVFDDWFSPGPEADDHWQRYERERGRTYLEALKGHHARNVFDFDVQHIDASDCVVLVMPAGKSAHMELGYAAGTKKPCFVLFEGEPERYDIMYLFANDVFVDSDKLIERLVSEFGPAAPNDALKELMRLAASREPGGRGRGSAN